MLQIIRSEEKRKEAFELLKRNYPDALELVGLDFTNIDADLDEEIVLWLENGDRYFFTKDGKFIGTKKY